MSDNLKIGEIVIEWDSDDLGVVCFQFIESIAIDLNDPENEAITKRVQESVDLLNNALYDLMK